MKIYVAILVCIVVFTLSIFVSRPDLFRRLFKSKDSPDPAAGKKPNP